MGLFGGDWLRGSSKEKEPWEYVGDLFSGIKRALPRQSFFSGNRGTDWTSGLTTWGAPRGNPMFRGGNSVGRGTGGYASGYRPGNYSSVAGRNQAAASQVALPSPQQPDTMALIQQLLSELDTDASNTGRLDAIFQPQQTALGNQRAELQRRYQEGNKHLGGMYDAFSRGIASREGEVAGNYNKGIQEVDAAGDAASAAIAANYDKSAAAQAAMLKQLGIEEAAPATLAPGAEDKAFQQGLVETSNTAVENALRSNRTSAVDFNKTQSNLAGLEGRNRQADLHSQFMGASSDLDTQAAELASRRAQMEFEVSQAAQQGDWERTRYLIDIMREDERYASESAAAQSEAMSEAQQNQYDNSSPWEKTYSTAIAQLGDRDANTAMQIIRQVGAGAPMQSQGQFINAVMQAGADRGLPPHILANIASQWYTQAKLPATYGQPELR